MLNDGQPMYLASKLNPYRLIRSHVICIQAIRERGESPAGLTDSLHSSISQLTVQLVWPIKLPSTRATPPLLQPILQHFLMSFKPCIYIAPQRPDFAISNTNMFSINHEMSVEAYSRPLDHRKLVLCFEMIRSQRDADLKSKSLGILVMGFIISVI